MEKQLSELIEKIDSLSEDYRNSLEVLSCNMPNTNQAEINNLKRIIGDFHPSEKSKTYRELIDENKSLRNELENTKKEFRSKLQQYKQLENELLVLRRSASENIAESSSANSNKKSTFRVFSQKKGNIPEVISEKTEEEKLKDFKKRLFDQRFSDSQVEYLTRIFLEGILSVDELMDLADYRLSPEKMHALYSILLSKHGLNLAENMPLILEETEANSSEEDTSSTIKSIPLDINITSSSNNIKKLAMQVANLHRR